MCDSCHLQTYYATVPHVSVMGKHNSFVWEPPLLKTGIKFDANLSDFCCCFAMLGIEPSTAYMQGKCFIDEPHPRPLHSVFILSGVK